MLRKKRFLIGGLVVIIALSYLAFTGFRQSATYYYTVSELVEQGAAAEGGKVKVNGQVAPGTVEQEGGKLVFTLTEGGSDLRVLYQGAVPDTFAGGNEVVVEGQLAGGVFQASNILTKCPSKYEPQS